VTPKAKRKQSPIVQRRNEARSVVRRDRIVLLMREHGEPMTVADLQKRMPRGIFPCTTQRDLDVLVDQRRVSCFEDAAAPDALFLLRCA
jgi:hypothetical protein